MDLNESMFFEKKNKKKPLAL